MGMGESVTRSSLSKASAQDDCRVFEKYAYCPVDEARSLNSGKVIGLNGYVYAFDSATIDFCLDVFKLVKFRKQKR